ncbi:hypothetical protein HYV44_03535 [Candidatus Microgenomates bacterium]|nr:hypothetical protein [Candidatus Microgenomates bacterium]
MDAKTLIAGGITPGKMLKVADFAWLTPALLRRLFGLESLGEKERNMARQIFETVRLSDEEGLNKVLDQEFSREGGHEIFFQKLLEKLQSS